MNRSFALIIFLSLNVLIAHGQLNHSSASVYIDTVGGVDVLFDDTPVGLGVEIIGEMNFIKQHNSYNELITPSTVIKAEKNSRGELHLRLFINADGVRVIASKINNTNKDLYKVYERNTFYYNGKPHTSTRAFERVIQVPSEQQNKGAYATIPSNPVTSRVDHKYTVEEIKTGKIVSTLLIEFVFPTPEPELVTSSETAIRQNDDRPSDIKIFDPDFARISEQEIIRLNRVSSTFNRFKGLPDSLVLPTDKNSLLFRFKPLRGYDFTDTYLEYKFATDTLWKTTVKKENPFLVVRDLQPGKYQLQVRYPAQDDHVLTYAFEIQAPLTKSTFYKVLAAISSTAIVCAILFIVYRKRQQAILKQELRKKQLLQNEIRSLRAQLQPHFIFNALSSIQSLVNKNDVEAANGYISKFGSLLHEILDKSDKTMHPLVAEIRQVEYYLQLEQLRFRFAYEIKVDENLNTSEIDIPVMLLQPYVENAIRHGIAENRASGKIGIWVQKQGNDLVIELLDNGKGYNVKDSKTGWGNTLVAERVAALNRLTPEQPIHFKVQSTLNEGTRIIIIFCNWLAS